MLFFTTCSQNWVLNPNFAFLNETFPTRFSDSPRQRATRNKAISKDPPERVFSLNVKEINSSHLLGHTPTTITTNTKVSYSVKRKIAFRF